MTKASDIDIARVLVCMCAGLTILQPGKKVLERPAYDGQHDTYAQAASQLKQSILEMKARLTTLDISGVPLVRALALTFDADICAGLPTGARAEPLDLSAEEQLHLIQNRYFDFIFLCERGLAPPDFRRSTIRPEDILTEIVWMYHRAPSEDFANALHLWCSRGLSVAKLLFCLRQPDIIRDTGTAGLFADIIKRRIAAAPLNAEQALALMGSRSDAFCVMAMMLAGAEPAETINTLPRDEAESQLRNCCAAEVNVG